MFHKVILIIGKVLSTLCSLHRACSSVFEALKRRKLEKGGHGLMTERQRRLVKEKLAKREKKNLSKENVDASNASKKGVTK